MILLEFEYVTCAFRTKYLFTPNFFFFVIVIVWYFDSLITPSPLTIVSVNSIIIVRILIENHFRPLVRIPSYNG